jgi:Raf kinase inhibitor-like YbhB/YbcL family protein
MNCRKPVEVIVLALCAALAGAGIALAQQQPVPPTPREVRPPAPQGGPTPAPPFSTQLQISSPVFAANGSIPSKYTCDGPGMNPPLMFISIPAKTQSLALIVDDPDVPKDLVPSGVFDHWLIWDLPPDTTGFGEGAGKGGINGMGQTGYLGPCPPDREHRYFFKLYALDTKLTAVKIANKKDLETAMQGHVIQRAELMGKYQRAGK